MYNIVAIFKDEGPYLAEWIVFHELQGFDNFVLYDNGSTDHGPAIARELGATVIPWQGKIKQLHAYHHAMRALPQGEWAAFIDIDEYLWAPSGQCVVELLPAVGKPQAFGVPWLMFGNNGHMTKPDGLTISNYTRREDHVNEHVKQIMRVDKRARFRDPHHTTFQFERTDPFLLCNHYWTRSVEEVHRKFSRGRADVPFLRQLDEFWNQKDSLNAVEDRRLVELWGDKLQQALSYAY